MTCGCVPTKAEVVESNLFSCERSCSRSLKKFAARSSELENQLLRFVGDHTAGDPPVPIPNTVVKPRRADGTARESVWECRSLPALKKGHVA